MSSTIWAAGDERSRGSSRPALKSINRELEANAQDLAGLKGYRTSLAPCPDGPPSPSKSASATTPSPPKTNCRPTSATPWPASSRAARRASAVARELQSALIILEPQDHCQERAERAASDSASTTLDTNGRSRSPAAHRDSRRNSDANSFAWVVHPSICDGPASKEFVGSWTQAAQSLMYLRTGSAKKRRTRAGARCSRSSAAVAR